MKQALHKSTGHAGFTLIELMVTVAIVSILAAIAYPSYTNYVKRGYRAAARSQLLQADQYMKRFYAANDSYSTDRGGTGVALPNRLRVSPPEAAAGSQLYSITVSSSTDGTAFTVTAAPASAMTGDKCGSFTIDQTGRKGVQSNTATRDECWR
jgi:type IV pilus assembly protein PilE